MQESGRFSGFADDFVSGGVGSNEMNGGLSPGCLRMLELEGAGWAARREFLRKRRRDGAPVNLPDILVKGVGHGMVANKVLPLPMDVRTLHAKQRGAATSLLKEKTKLWLESDVGLEWQRERKMLFSAGIEEEVATAKGGGASSSTSK